MSEASSENNPKKPDITTSSEAFTALGYENGLNRWRECDRISREHGGVPVVVEENKGQDECDQKTLNCRGARKYMSAKDNTELETIYSLSNSGQSLRGGWTSDGIARFNELKDSAKIGRARPECAAWEDQLKDAMRAHNGVVAATWEEHISGRRSSLTNPTEPTEEISYISDSDDEANDGSNDDNPARQAV